MKLLDQPWPNGFQSSRLASIYVQELYWLAYQVIEKSNRILQSHPNKPAQLYAAADTDTLDVAYSMLSNAAKIAELLHPLRNRKIYHERAAYLKSLIAPVNFSAIVDKKVRNTIEHYGEYLDDANYIHSTFQPKKLYLVAFNFVFSHLVPSNDPAYPFPVFASPLDGQVIFPVRVYVASTRMLHNLFWSIDLGMLVQQASAIKEALKVHLPEEHPEDWVSAAIAIGP